MPTDIQIYCDYMADVRNRIGVVQGVLAGRITTGAEAYNIELIFLQLRKTLELIAFGSLCANKTAYSAAHKNFASHWKAKAMLEALAKVNPDFYPVPLDPPQELAPGRKHFPRPADGFMTQDEFERLYDAASDVLHTRNPFTEKDSVIQIGYSVPEWVARIQKLLGWHVMHLAGGDKWIVNIPAEGNVNAWPASPTD
jgi:hypothetical protein